MTQVVQVIFLEGIPSSIKMPLFLTVSRWKMRPRHYYGTIRNAAGETIQEILQCATRQRVLEIAGDWSRDFGKLHKTNIDLDIDPATRYF
jgi:hypothetical protein